MAESILNGMRILAVDDEPDVLAALEDEIHESAPKCQLEKAISYQEASKKLASQNYDLVILDIMGVRGFDLLNQAVNRNFKVAMLTAYSLNPESLKRSVEMKARAYLPKEKLGEIVSFLEDIVKESDHAIGWGRLMSKLKAYFDSRWGEYWQKAEENFWKDFGEKTPRIKR
jgi:DNA-binding response OmpR family regulator